MHFNNLAIANNFKKRETKRRLYTKIGLHNFIKFKFEHKKENETSFKSIFFLI